MNITDTPSARKDSIPWYRTRWFWGVIIGAMIAWGLFSFLSALQLLGREINVILTYLSFSFGASFFSLLGSKLFGQIGSISFTIIYLIIMVFLGYKTFKKRRVQLVYPIVFVLLFLLGSIIGTLYLSGL